MNTKLLGLVAGVSIAAGGSASSQETLEMTSAFGKNLPILGTAAVDFVSKINSISEEPRRVVHARIIFGLEQSYFLNPHKDARAARALLKIVPKDFRIYVQRYMLERVKVFKNKNALLSSILDTKF